MNKNVMGWLLIAAMLPATAVVAQTAAPQEPPRTIPGLEIATPSGAQTPVPVPTDPVRGLVIPGVKPGIAHHARDHVAPQTARPTPSATEPAPSSKPQAAPILPPAIDVSPESTPSAPATPSVVATPSDPATPSVAATPSAAAMPDAPADMASADDDHAWLWVALGGLFVAVALTGWAWRRRAVARHKSRGKRRSSKRRSRPKPAVLPPLPVEPLPVASPVPQPDPLRARLDLALRPLRAGLNMLSATLEAEVTVTNTGDGPATQVRLHPTLLSAHAGQDADLAATFAASTGRPAAPPFALAPGEERRIRIVAALPREAIRSMEAGGRAMFVPLVALDVRYVADAAGTAARTGQAFVVGVEQAGSTRLAPFWLDAPMRMHDRVAARAQGAVLVE